MAESDENISLKDRYESLKLLCSEQVLANELLKDELEKLRKNYQEISRHRAFLLEKVIELQSKSNQSATSEAKRSSSNQNRNTQAQRNRAPQSRLRTTIQRPQVYPSDEMPYEESDAESESMQGDFENGWEEGFNHMAGPSYRRPPMAPPSKNVKRQPVKMIPQSSHAPAFKRPRIIDDEPGPSSRGNYANSHGGIRSQMPYDYAADNATDFSEEPPLIYSKSASSVSASGYPMSESGPRRTTPNILKPSTTSSSIVSGGNVSDRLFNPPKPSPLSGGGYYGPRIH